MQTTKILKDSLNYLTELSDIIALYYFWAVIIFPLGYENMSLSHSSLSELLQGRAFEKALC